MVCEYTERCVFFSSSRVGGGVYVSKLGVRAELSGKESCFHQPKDFGSSRFIYEVIKDISFNL